MPPYRFTTLEPAPAAADSLRVLAEALREAPSVGRRVRASGDNRSPDEGLALLDAYVAIADRRVRQAILDVVLSIAPAGRE